MWATRAVMEAPEGYREVRNDIYVSIDCHESAYDVMVGVECQQVQVTK